MGCLWTRVNAHLLQQMLSDNDQNCFAMQHSLLQLWRAEKTQENTTTNEKRARAESRRATQGHDYEQYVFSLITWAKGREHGWIIPFRTISLLSDLLLYHKSVNMDEDHSLSLISKINLH